MNTIFTAEILARAGSSFRSPITEQLDRISKSGANQIVTKMMNSPVHRALIASTSNSVMQQAMRQASEQAALIQKITDSERDREQAIQKVFEKYRSIILHQQIDRGKSPVLKMLLNVATEYNDIELPGWFNQMAMNELQLGNQLRKNAAANSLRDVQTYLLFDILKHLRKKDPNRFFGDSIEIVGNFLNFSKSAIQKRIDRVEKLGLNLNLIDNEDYWIFKAPIDDFLKYINVVKT
jgi:hypothetical protein